MKLHYLPGSPFARVVRVLLRELRLDCEEVMLAAFPPSAAYFAVNPLGQVPALETDQGTRFPTRLILDHLLALPRRGSSPIATAVRRSAKAWQDEQTLTLILAMGDTLAAMKYQEWTGLEPVGENRVGLDLAARNAERVVRTLDWLEARATPEGFLPGALSLQDIALACVLLWIDARGGFPWRGRPRLEAIVAACAPRPSFQATAPQPWP